jgi:hypothetical protein
LDANDAMEEALKGTPFDPSTARGRLLALHHSLTQEARLLMEKKNADYASEDDPYANFRMFGLVGIVVRLGDKLARLKTFTERGSFKVQDEQLHDTLLDIINYAVLFEGMSKEK